MTDKVLEAIETEIADLNSRLDHLKNIRDSYTNPASDSPRLSGKELGDIIIEWIMGTDRPNMEFTNAEVAHNTTIPAERVNNAIRNLIKRGYIKDNTPSKTRHKLYGLTAKGKKNIFPDIDPEPKPKPKPKRDNTQAKARLKAAREKEEAKATSPGTREKQLLEYLQKTKNFTREQAAKAMDYPSTGSAQVTMDKYNRQANGGLYKPLRKDGKTMIYVSLLYRPPQYPSVTSGTTTATTREVRITPGEGVSPGRLREVK